MGDGSDSQSWQGSDPTQGSGESEEAWGVQRGLSAGPGVGGDWSGYPTGGTHPPDVYGSDASGARFGQGGDPPGQYPPGQYPPGHYPTGSYPSGRYPAAPYPPGSSLGAGTYPPAVAMQSPDVESGRSRGRRHLGPAGWVAVVVVAAVVGAAAGAVVGSAVSRSSNVVVARTSRSKPGPAVVDGASIPTIVHRLLPEVVAIDAKGTLAGVVGGALYGVGSGLPTAESFESAGTGMIVSTNGLVITNNHVIAGASSVAITLDGTTKALPARVVGTDPSHDMALLQIDHPPAGLHPVTFGNSADLVPGDAVIAIGNALALSAGSPTVTSGIVSALGRTVTATIPTTGVTETLTDMIQTDAAINPGNSGGPLVDSAGDVVGMDTATAGTTSDGTQAVDIGFAIPSEDLQAALPGLERGGTSGTPGAYLGVQVEDNSVAFQQEYGFAVSTGAVVVNVAPGSPAESAGLVPGDVIVGFDNQAVGSATGLAADETHVSPGDKVPVVFYNGSAKETVQVTLATQPAP